jgi:hypothetical protein
MTDYRAALALFAAALAIAFIAASIVTLGHVDTREASNGPATGRNRTCSATPAAR